MYLCALFHMYERKTIITINRHSTTCEYVHYLEFISLAFVSVHQSMSPVVHILMFENCFCEFLSLTVSLNLNRRENKGPDSDM